ncbi:hypothetical protein [Dactylosporangium sp. NPDC005555]|uniref:hypothetical protein n=1 Tax=Dactylosporangium sp. NPDC005555 TaxID=3154889 RepID=UPI0033BD50C1
MSARQRQELDAAFQRRVAQRQQQSAANWQHAVQVGQGLGLGEPLGIYHAEITPPLGTRRVLLLIAPVPVFVAGVVLLALWAPDAAVPVLGVSPVLAGGYILGCALAARRRRFTRWLYGYTGGLAEADPEGPPRPVRWDEVTDVVDEWSSSGSESGWDYDGFRLTIAGGRILPVTAGYSNALDPYGPAGGIIAALLPGEVGAAIPRFPSIGDLITGQAVSRVVARQAAAVRAGGVLTRGDVRVTRDGIGGPKDATPTPWAAIERIELRPGRVKVRPFTGRARTYDNYRDGSGYSVLCRVLLELGVQASFEARG